MRHQTYNPDFKFVHEPLDFDRDTDKQLLQYCLGANLYMPATKDFAQVILKNKIQGLASIVMCFEDAIKEEDLPAAEENSFRFLERVHRGIQSGEIQSANLPLVFFRVRSFQHFLKISEKLKPEHLDVLVGFVFPKFNAMNGNDYLSHLQAINEKLDYKILYGMPILEDARIAYQETRESELLGIRFILEQYKKYILNVRVGATDFSSRFGMRRNIEYSVYDIVAVRDCLADILNMFSRENDYVLSGPVWEYFNASSDMKFMPPPKPITYHSFFGRERVINAAIDGLLREVILDKANGFIGKTIIHPTHMKYVNAMMAVTQEEYEDAVMILGTTGGVVKSGFSNKMNEINPHTNWAKKITMQAKAYGVIKNQESYFELFS